MKKFYAMIAAMMVFFAHSLCAAPITEPEPGKTYMIQHYSGLFLTLDGNKFVLEQPGGGTQQTYTFEEVTDEAASPAFAISLGDGKYVGTDTGWTPKVMTGNDDRLTHFTFPLANDPEYVTIFCLGHSNSSYWAPDNASAGQGVYSNKGNGSTLAYWQIVEAGDGVITTGLESAIASLKAILDNNEIGDALTQAGADAVQQAIATAEAAMSATSQAEVNEATTAANNFASAAKSLISALTSANNAFGNATAGSAPGNYVQEAYDTFAEAIASAKAAWAENSAEAISAAASALNTAATTFDGNRIVFLPKEGAKYYFINTTTKLLMGISNGEAVTQNATGDDCQKFELIPVEGHITQFNFKIADGSGYLARKGNWNTTVVADVTPEACFGMRIYDLDNLVYTINAFDDTRVMSPNDANVNSTLYTDKWSLTSWSQWEIREVVDGELLTMGYDAAVANAEKYIASAVIGEQPGNYPQEAVDALKAALSAAQNSNASTQAELNEVTATLNAAINAFLAEKIDPFFVPAENTYYRFSVRKYQSNYTTNNDGAAGTSAFTPMDKSQWLTFQPVEGLKYTYIVKNDGKALTYDGTFVEVADADAPKWTTIYTNTYNSVPYFALCEYDDPSKVMTFGSGKNFAIQSLNKGETAHQGRILPVDPVNDPNLTNLIDWEAYCYVTLENIDRGPAIGQYSDAKCEAFEALVKEIANYAGATQEEVDAKTAALSEAVSAFLNNPNSVIKDELDAALAAAAEKAEAAVIGIEAGEYYWSEINAFKAQIEAFEKDAANVSEQDECDELTETVKAATEAFAGNAETQTVKAVLDDAIECATELYNAEKDNVGDNQGQRPQEIIDAFAAAIAAANAVDAPEITDLEALLDAVDAFLNGAISQNRTPLRKAIADAEAEEFADLRAGDFNGCYPQEAIDNFNAALENAKEAEADMTLSQEEIDAACKQLTDAMAALRKAVVTVTFTALDKAIEAAATALEGAEIIGDEKGQCPQAVVDALAEVIAEAEEIDRDAINQTDVDAMTAKLDEATATFRTKLVESTGISDAIADAKALLEGAVQGMKPGNYPVTAIAGLKTAIEAAEEVAADTESTQADLVAAVNSLTAAMESFLAQVIASHDLTNLNALIEEAEKLIAETGSSDYALTVALEEAKAIAADPDNYTKAELTKAEQNLRKAIDFAKESGLASVTAESFSMTVANGTLCINGLEGTCTIMVYTMDGRMIASASVAEPTFTLALNAGKYVVAVSAEGFATSRVVIVR